VAWRLQANLNQVNESLWFHVRLVFSDFCIRMAFGSGVVPGAHHITSSRSHKKEVVKDGRERMDEQLHVNI